MNPVGLICSLYLLNILYKNYTNWILPIGSPSSEYPIKYDQKIYTVLNGILNGGSHYVRISGKTRRKKCIRTEAI